LEFVDISFLKEKYPFQIGWAACAISGQGFSLKFDCGVLLLEISVTVSLLAMAYLNYGLIQGPVIGCTADDMDKRLLFCSVAATRLRNPQT
jgi:hypothetical protein